MEILKQIAAKGKQFGGWLKGEFDKIENPLARMVILMVAVTIVLVMVWKALPVLILFGLIATAVWFVAALSKDT